MLLVTGIFTTIMIKTIPLMAGLSLVGMTWAILGMIGGLVVASLILGVLLIAAAKFLER